MGSRFFPFVIPVGEKRFGRRAQRIRQSLFNAPRTAVALTDGGYASGFDVQPLCYL